MKVKVIELVGSKLDPKAKYMFVINTLTMTREDIWHLRGEIENLIGDKFVMVAVKGSPEDAIKVYEIPK